MTWQGLGPEASPEAGCSARQGRGEMLKVAQSHGYVKQVACLGPGQKWCGPSRQQGTEHAESCGEDSLKTMHLCHAAWVHLAT